MKFSARTIQILRNFSTIHQSIIFQPGKQLKTISQSKTIMARATIDTEIEKSFAIYDLPQFLSAISLFGDPELEVTDSAMIIRSGKEKLNYTFSEPSLILSPPEKEIQLPTTEVQFELKHEDLVRVQKALGIIGAPEIAVTGDEGKIYVEALNTRNSSDSTYRVAVGTTDKTFRFIFLAENIKLDQGDYALSISSKGLSHFTGITNDIEYWVAIEATSTFED